MKISLLMFFKIVVLMLCISIYDSSASSNKPNFIVIMTDDQGYNDVGFNGCKDIPTPNIDRIAYEGIKFTDGYVSYPVCGPSRAGLLTGRYQDRFGFTTNPTISPDHPEAGIPLDEKNIAEVLGSVGYTSAIVGKWHMGSHPVHHPLNRGFDHFFGFLSGGHNYFPREYNLNDLSEVKRPYQWYSTKLFLDDKRVDVDADYLTDVLSDASVNFIKKCAKDDKPFFLFLAYNAPHNPLQATKKYLDRFAHIENWGRKHYSAMVSAVDDGVGKVLDVLSECNIDENTLIFFLSDNGGASNNSSDNGILREHKGTLFEGGIRVPFALRWKNHIPSNKVFSYPIISLDIMATCSALADAPISIDKPLDGVNLIPYIRDEITTPPHDYLYWRKFDHGGLAVRSADIKVVKDRRSDKQGVVSYNIINDISEKEDISQSRLKEKSKLVDLHNKWNAELEPTRFPTLGNHKWWIKNKLEGQGK